MKVAAAKIGSPTQEEKSPTYRYLDRFLTLDFSGYTILPFYLGMQVNTAVVPQVLNPFHNSARKLCLHAGGIELTFL